MAIRDELLRANREYAEGFDRGDLPMPPARRFVVVTCMDARIDPRRSSASPTATRTCSATPARS